MLTFNHIRADYITQTQASEHITANMTAYNTMCQATQTYTAPTPEHNNLNLLIIVLGSLLTILLVVIDLFTKDARSRIRVQQNIAIRYTDSGQNYDLEAAVAATTPQIVVTDTDAVHAYGTFRGRASADWR